MSRRRFAGVCLAFFVASAALGLGIAPTFSTSRADQGTDKSDKPSKKPAADHGKDKKTRDTKKRAADNKEKKPAPHPLDVNRLSMEYKALRTLRNLEATPAQLSEIARLAKTTIGNAGKREPAKAANAYIDTLKELREALVKNNEEKMETLQEKLDELREKDPPDLDDEIDITDAAEMEVQRLLNMLSPQQVLAYGESLGDDLPDPVQLILDGIEEGRELKKEEWEATRDELAEKISWLVCGLNGENALKLEEQVSTFLDRTHAGQGKTGGREVEIRKLLGSPGPFVLLNNILEHDLAMLLSNARLKEATKACLRGQGTQIADAEKPVTQAPAPHPQKHKKVAEAPSPAGKSGNSKKPAKSGKSTRGATAADLDDVLKSPEKFDGQDLKFEDVTITGTAPGKQDKFLLLEIKTGSGKVVPATRGQKLTIVIAKADAPESIAQMKPDRSVSATLICHIGSSSKGKHWDAKVRHIDVHANK